MLHSDHQTSALNRLATYRDVASLLLKHVPKLSKTCPEVASKFEVTDEIEPSSDATALVKDLENLGPTFVKIGQLLSTRVDLMPPEYVAALQKLQDDVETVPFEQIKESIERQLGSKLSQLFDDFSETPLASASIGQVHRATLRDGKREVAVKIRRPEIREKMQKELEVIQEVAEFLGNHTKFGARFDLPLVARQFRTTILEELDYNEEAKNLNRLAENLAGHPLIAVPLPIGDYCSDGILTMEYIDGTKLTDLSGVVMVELDGETLAEELFVSYLKQVTVDGFFHADPHPGNILLTRDHRLGLIDLGMVGKVPNDLKDHLIQFLGAVAEGHSARAVRTAVRMGVPREDFSRENFEQVIKKIVVNRKDATVEDLRVGALVMEVISACGENGLRIPDSVYMIGKMLLNIDLIGEVLCPSFNPDESIRRNLATLAGKRAIDQMSRSSLIHYASEVKELIMETPERLNRALDAIASNQVTLNVAGLDENNLLKGFHRVANRITVGLILSAMIIGASMMMHIESRFTILGYPGLAMIFFLVAAIGGLVLVWKIVFEESS